MTSKEKILQVKGLKQFFNVGQSNEVQAVNDISFDVFKGETFGLVGESGCGKSTTGRAIIRLYDPTSGEIIFQDKEVHDIKGKKDMLSFRRDMQMIFQDPYASLNPKMKVRDLIAEGIDIHGLAESTADRNKQVDELLKTVGLNPDHSTRYPHEFSGGQRQRIGIARALAVQPKFIICDEPISALDVSIQAQVVNLLMELQKEKGLTYLFIAHDLSMVKYISDRIGVMYYGRLVELAPADEVYNNPLHPYTESLLSAVPLPDPNYERSRIRIPYQPREATGAEEKLREITPGHFVYCTEADIPALQAKAASYKK
ncbi:MULTISPECIES: ABC transporter ATP-binding protein [Carnobacterium]|jgi:oligopeptide transport system ATP-binding protein|uniref:Oligopeptide/dipeptide ABC transporter,ATP-binding, C-terminal domain protein n=2 Tax=Carnobacterium maltaromaticum TaxID=2751 RepID=K8E5A0_CARML|nr:MULTISPECIES: ATP-binding cassette domain-containing protein [Carnobacterium]AOA02504.1 peptide ABC transporter substrate-binding protein [Carnobacterium maltaromaticum]KRN59984.1 oligopeptide ABC transporter, ATP-binding protein [Carnobacterium maltaromaticum DSM 20342]KRN73301.1 oligopeptide ABC transporter, ATP-binding protein [Carnobacterium maltaromaticum]KRN85517.1 oligopeptide ABC transporter, ATP-binding protein [Carnobacterium maltaromaticum]MBC9789147.1 ATP-binding cassette domain